MQIYIDSNYPKYLAEALRLFHSISSPLNRFKIVYRDKNLSELDVENTIVLLVDYSKGDIEIPVRKHFEYGYRVIAFRKYTVNKLDPFKWSLRVLSIWERILETIEDEQGPFLYTYGYNSNRLYKKN